MVNVHKDEENKMKWKRGSRYPKSVVITDYELAKSIRIRERYMVVKGTAGWAPPEQWLAQFMKWSVENAFGSIFVYL